MLVKMELKFVAILLCGFVLTTSMCLTIDERKAELKKELNRDEANLFSRSYKSRERLNPYRYPRPYAYQNPYGGYQNQNGAYQNPYGGYQNQNPYGYGGYPPYYMPTTVGFPMSLFVTTPPPFVPFPYNLFTTEPPPRFPFNLFATTKPPFLGIFGKKKK